jgi:hypothetical protein
MKWALIITASAVTHEEEQQCATPTGTDVTSESTGRLQVTEEEGDIMRDTWTR